jgi:hypothetical protein
MDTEVLREIQGLGIVITNIFVFFYDRGYTIKSRLETE